MNNPQSTIRNSKCSAQAMMELAIFGTFLLFGLVLITRFGMGFYNSLKTSQEAFRLALKTAYDTRAYDGVPSTRPAKGTERAELLPGNQGSVILVKDVFLPDPSNPFATGTPTPLVSSAAVTWGTDSAEFVAADTVGNTDLPKTLIKANNKEFWLLSTRFHDEDWPYSGDIGTLLCDYEDAYGELIVDFLDAGGSELTKPTADLTTCLKTGVAKIELKGSTPTTVRIHIIDSCRADVIDPSECHAQCERIKTYQPPLRSYALPVPAYCGVPPISNEDEDPPLGLDYGNFVRTHTVNNRMKRTEDTLRIKNDTTISETVTVNRKIRTNPNVTPDYPVSRDSQTTYIDATSSASRTRSQQWNTKW